MKRSLRFLCCVFILAGVALIATACAKTARPMEFGMAVPSTGGMDKEKVGNIILQGGANTYWMLTPVSDGVITGVLDYKNYRLEVAIHYTGQGYSIQFVRGEELDSGDTRYQKVYNNWIKRLDWRIRKEFLQYSRDKN